MRAAAYKVVHNHNVCDTVDNELSDQPLFCNTKINTAKDFGKALISKHDSVPCAKQWLLEQEIWIRNRRTHNYGQLVTKETRLRVLQWKILHNIYYPTNIILCEMKSEK